MFQVGKKAVCINDNWISHYLSWWERFKSFFKSTYKKPKKNEIVIVAKIVHLDLYGVPTMFLCLEGYTVKGKYIPFIASMFRPLDEDENFAEDVCEYILQEVRKEQLEEALKVTA